MSWSGHETGSAYQAGGERRGRLSKGLGSHADQVRGLGGGLPGLLGGGVRQQVLPCKATKHAEVKQTV